MMLQTRKQQANIFVIDTSVSGWSTELQFTSANEGFFMTNCTTSVCCEYFDPELGYRVHLASTYACDTRTHDPEKDCRTENSYRNAPIYLIAPPFYTFYVRFHQVYLLRNSQK